MPSEILLFVISLTFPLVFRKNTLTDTEEMKNRLKTIENMMFDLTEKINKLK